MDSRQVVALSAGLVALSLVAAPVTMAAWSQQASFSVDHVDEPSNTSAVPVIRYGNLSTPAQRAVRRAIESLDGHYVVYGRGDWPDRFFYSDNSAPGKGLYIIDYHGDYYRLYTSAVGGFAFLYWLLEVPFILYGLALAYAAGRVYRDRLSLLTVSVAALAGVAFHLLGPELDFPLLRPTEFVILGGFAVLALWAGLTWQRWTDQRTP